MILEITYTWMESYPLSNKHKQLIKILSSCLQKLRVFFLKYDFRSTCPTILNNYFQKKPPEVFFKKVALKNFRNIHLKTHVLALFLTKLRAFRPTTLLKRNFSTGVFRWILHNFKSTYLKNICGRSALGICRPLLST